jgi:hypothetical protein
MRERSNRQTKNARPFGRALPEKVPADLPYAVSTVEGSTFTPGPIVEVTAMRWM